MSHLPIGELWRIHRDEKATFARLNEPMTHIEQPGQPSPSAQLNAIRRLANQLQAALAEWTESHDSDAEPFKTSVAWGRQALRNVCEAGKNLDNAAAELLYGREG